MLFLIHLPSFSFLNNSVQASLGGAQNHDACWGLGGATVAYGVWWGQSKVDTGQQQHVQDGGAKRSKQNRGGGSDYLEINNGT